MRVAPPFCSPEAPGWPPVPGELYVHNNPINHVDPLGLRIKQDWDDRSVELFSQGGAWNGAKGFGIQLGIVALRLASLGTFDKNDRLETRNLAGEISDGQFYGGIAGDS